MGIGFVQLVAVQDLAELASLLAAALEALLALILCILGWFEAGGIAQAAGATETTLLIYGVGLLPVAVMVAVSYALWAGLCVAFIAFGPRPEVRDRLGILDGRIDD